MKRLFICVLLSCFSLRSHSMLCTDKHNTHKLKRKDKSTCTFYFDKSATQNSYSILLLLQGSETKSAIQYLPLADDSWQKRMNVATLIVEKPGVTQDTFDKEQYLQLNSLVQRAEDCQLVINHLRTTDSQWNGKLIIYGISEGATLAAYISNMIPEAKAVIMLCGGCGMSLREEILLLQSKSSPEGLQGFFQKHLISAYINCMLSLAKLFPNSSYTCVGETNTLKYWNNIADYNPLDTLETLDIPLYLAHGTDDTNCPVESAEKLVQHFETLGKTNLCYHCYTGYDHGFNDREGSNHFCQVEREALAWAETILVSAPILII